MLIVATFCFNGAVLADQTIIIVAPPCENSQTPESAEIEGGSAGCGPINSGTIPIGGGGGGWGGGGSSSPPETIAQCHTRINDLENKCKILYGATGLVTAGFCKRLSLVAPSWGASCTKASIAATVTAYLWCTTNAKALKLKECK